MINKREIKKLVIDLTDFLENCLTPAERQLAQDYWDLVKENNYQQFDQYGSDVRHRIMNLIEIRRGAIYGFAEWQINDVGWIDKFVFPEIEVIDFKTKEDKAYWNNIKIGKSPNGLFTYSVSYKHGCAGGGWALSVFGDPYKTREICLKDALLYIKNRFDKAVKSDDRTNFKMPYCANVLKLINDMLKTDNDITIDKKGQILMFA